jgi:hypothetical protein
MNRAAYANLRRKMENSIEVRVSAKNIIDLIPLAHVGLVKLKRTLISQPREIMLGASTAQIIDQDEVMTGS